MNILQIARRNVKPILNGDLLPELCGGRLLCGHNEKIFRFISKKTNIYVEMSGNSDAYWLLINLKKTCKYSSEFTVKYNPNLCVYITGCKKGPKKMLSPELLEKINFNSIYKNFSYKKFINYNELIQNLLQKI